MEVPEAVLKKEDISKTGVDKLSVLFDQNETVGNRQQQEKAYEKGFVSRKRKRPQLSKGRKSYGMFKSGSENSVDLKVISWNVEGKGSPEEIDDALIKTEDRAQIVCLQEANFPASLDSTKHYKWLYSGTKGSAILVSKGFDDFEVCSFESICAQICIVEVTKKGHKTKVISCLIPPVTDYLCEEIWNKLDELLKAIPLNLVYVLAGDFNAQIGAEDISNVYVGRVGNILFHQKSNENGLKLLELTRRTCLRIATTYGQPTTNRQKNSCTLIDGEYKSQQDFILIPFPKSRVEALITYHHTGPLHHWHPGYRHAMVKSTFNIKSLQEGFKHLGVEGKPLITTWNVNGASPAKVDALLAAQQLQVVCIQELFITSAEDLNTEHFTWHSSGKTWTKDVAIMVKKSEDIVVSNFQSISNCLCTLDMQFYSSNVKVICCFLPPKDDPKSETAKVQLKELIESIPENDWFVLAGDFNLDISSTDMTEEKTNHVSFLKELAEKHNLSVEDIFWGKKTLFKKHLITQVSAKGVNRPHHILMPMFARLVKSAKLFIQFVPYFENAIVSLILEKPIETGEKIISKMENGCFHQIKTLEFMEPCESTNVNISLEDVEKFKDTPPSSDDLARLLNDLVLLSNLKIQNQPIKGTDNQMYIGFANDLLMTSFSECKFGILSMEETSIITEVSLKKFNTRVIRIKWQGIVLEELEKKYTEISLKEQQRLCLESLVNKLGKCCYSVKERKSYFNKGYEPVLMNDPKLKDTLKIYKKADCPSMPDVLKHIENFFADDTDCELAFGPDFPKDDLDIIESFAKENSLHYRYFNLAAKKEDTNHIALSKKRTPQYIRDKLLKNETDHKYYLIPPAGPQVTNYRTYVREKENEFFTKYEDGLCAKFWSIVKESFQTGNSLVKAKQQTTLKKQATLKKQLIQKSQPIQGRVPPPKKPIRRIIRQPEVNRKRFTWQQENRRPTIRNKLPTPAQKISQAPTKQSRPLLRFSKPRPSYPKPMESTPRKRLYRMSFDELTEELHSRPLITPGRGVVDSGIFDVCYNDDFDNSYRANDNYNRDNFGNGNYTSNSNTYGSDNFGSGNYTSGNFSSNNFGSGDFTSDNYGSNNYGSDNFGSGNNTSDNFSSNNFGSGNFTSDSFSTNSFGNKNYGSKNYVSGNYSSDNYDSGNYSSGNYGKGNYSRGNYGSDNYNSDNYSSNNYTSFENERPKVKRQKLNEWDQRELVNERENLPKRNIPNWHQVAPLVMVWPITIRSKVENRASIILKENYPTDFQMNRHNFTAVLVTLPMRNGSQKKFCLSVGKDHNKAARDALDLIVKHSTVIKPSAAYLCDGLAPNFVRYNVPCQTNPRTYIILSKRETGPLNEDSVSEILTTFKASYNEDVYFDRHTYSRTEKTLIMNMAERFDLKYRHFGETRASSSENHWVCVYKVKPHEQLLEELLRMRGSHPKYTITTNRLPPSVGLNIF